MLTVFALPKYRPCTWHYDFQSIWHVSLVVVRQVDGGQLGSRCENLEVSQGLSCLHSNNLLSQCPDSLHVTTTNPQAMHGESADINGSIY